MNTDPNYWHRAGLKDREIGNDTPGMRPEDFHREIEDEATARLCAKAYQAGFEGRPRERR